ncbi:hypothetical protein NP493_1925g00016 [Ridgeia piscesae]|uniref:Uncharacterized protein n=1 Tax=Ridgeia piscesae TaxID=27915 RepID=A0AAD9JPF8_RIDPI|nr:hypothetical protein NP493_1925g00016 [Ridgeia piscesae]
MPRANSPFLKTNFDGVPFNNDVPCAVCHVTGRQAKLMIPARKECPGGWTREYHGYLTTSADIYHPTTFECMDEAPEVIEGMGRDSDGALFYTVEGDCSRSLPCPNYVNGWALTCIVCTK